MWGLRRGGRTPAIGGLFSERGRYAVDPWSAALSADFNGDGAADLLVHSTLLLG